MIFISSKFCIKTIFILLSTATTSNGMFVAKLYNSLPSQYSTLLDEIGTSLRSPTPRSPRRLNISNPKRTTIDSRNLMDNLILLIFRNGRIIEQQNQLREAEEEIPPPPPPLPSSSPIMDDTSPLRQRASSIPEWDESFIKNDQTSSPFASASVSHIDTPVNDIPLPSSEASFRNSVLRTSASASTSTSTSEHEPLEPLKISIITPEQLPLFIYNLPGVVLSLPLFPRDIIIFSTFPSAKMLQAKEERKKNRAYTAQRRKLELENEKVYCHSGYTVEDLKIDYFQEDREILNREIEEEIRILQEEKNAFFSKLRNAVLNLEKATSSKYLKESFADLEVAMLEIIPDSYPSPPKIVLPRAQHISSEALETISPLKPKIAVTYPALLEEFEEESTTTTTNVRQTYGTLFNCSVAIESGSRICISLKEYSAVLFDSNFNAIRQLSHFVPKDNDRFILPSIKKGGDVFYLLCSWDRTKRMALMDDEIIILLKNHLEDPSMTLEPRDGSKISVYEITK